MKNLSVYMPALNEESDIQISIDNVILAAKESLDNYEIILVDDGSTDKTAEIMEKNAKINKNIKIIRHDHPLGLAHIFFECVKIAKYDNLTWVHCDNPWTLEGLKNLFSSIEKDTLVIGYRVNLLNNRQFLRIILTKGLTFYCSLLAGVYLRDVHGPCIIPVNYYKKLNNLKADHISYHIELVIRLIRLKVNVKFTPVPLNSNVDDKSITLRNNDNIKSIIKTLFYLTFH